jgi:hypothetical protein
MLAVCSNALLFRSIARDFAQFTDMTRYKNTLTEITGKGALTQSIKKRLLSQGKLNPVISF